MKPTYHFLHLTTIYRYIEKRDSDNLHQINFKRIQINRISCSIPSSRWDNGRIAVIDTLSLSSTPSSKIRCKQSDLYQKSDMQCNAKLVMISMLNVLWALLASWLIKLVCSWPRSKEVSPSYYQKPPSYCGKDTHQMYTDASGR